MASPPEQLVAEFRRIAQERLQKIDQAWDRLKQGHEDAAAQTLHRELHTLKGEAQMLGFTDVHLICHRLEDLVEFAKARGYAVREDLDVVVVTAIQFAGMLARKRVGQNLAGVDLPGFVRQIDKTLREGRQDFTNGGRTRTSGLMPALATNVEQLTPNLRAKLASAAADSFVEYAVAKGARRNRLRGSWHNLREVIAMHRASFGDEQLEKHRAGAAKIAASLGKQVMVELDVAPVEVTSEILAAIDLVVLHTIRNALDHGIEDPATRTMAGKTPMGWIRVIGRADADSLIVTIADDGRGIDFAKVKKRALELGLIDASTDIETCWVDIVAQPGFSTREAASDTSGRGVGLDAARAAIARVGGRLAATSAPVAGTTWTMQIARPRIACSGYALKMQNIPFVVMLEGWDTKPTTAEPVAIDLAKMLGLTDQPPTGGTVTTFYRGKTAIALTLDSPPRVTEARRLVATGEKSLFDVVLVDMREGISFRPELFFA